jgi:hypothetical protein
MDLSNQVISIEIPKQAMPETQYEIMRCPKRGKAPLPGYRLSVIIKKPDNK